MPALDRPDLLADPVVAVLRADGSLAAQARVAAIDPDLADTASFCAAYGRSLDESANCVVLAAKRSGETILAACVVLATTRADVNGLARRTVGARKASFAAMDVAVSASGMEQGGITPIGLPADLAGAGGRGRGRRRRRGGGQRPPPVEAARARRAGGGPAGRHGAGRPGDAGGRMT